MLLLIVCAVVVVLALVVLGSVVHGLLGAVGRLTRELTALQREVAPVAGRLRASVASVSATAAVRRTPSDA